MDLYLSIKLKLLYLYNKSKNLTPNQCHHFNFTTCNTSIRYIWAIL